MNRKMIRFVLGYVLMIEAALMVLPIVTGFVYGETRHSLIYIGVALFTLLTGFILGHKKPKNNMFYIKEGGVITALSWILMSMFGALPFVITGDIPSYTDALFETISGFTTTGSSILTNVEALSHANLMWRSFTHWVGGMGVLVFILMILPMTGGSTMNLMKAESPGPEVGKLVPTIKKTSRTLYILYAGITLAEIIILICLKMPVFDAICTGFGTAGTGGFGVRNTSIADYSAAIQWVVAFFMIRFGVNFNFYYYISIKKPGEAFRMEEVRTYLGIIGVVTVIMTANLLKLGMGLLTTLRHVIFQIATVMTTTGFATTDFNLWPTTSRMLLVARMFVGVCAGSTGGGVKVSRCIIMVKAVINEMSKYLFPKRVKALRREGREVDPDVVHSVLVYFGTFILIFVASMLIVTYDGNDLTTTFTAIAATINNIGPGLNRVGPTRNYAHFSHLSKYVMMFDMLAGRLELIPMLMLFNHVTMKELLFPKPKK